MKKYYLAYGSNLNMMQMKIRCNNAIPIGTTKLESGTIVLENYCNKFGK